jgi:hypothetical protein
MKTKVIFRSTDNDEEPEVIAFFPELPGDSNPFRTCLCYEHAGQHGAASLEFYRCTKPASLDEFLSLWAELESIGYDLRIGYKITRKDTQARIKACNL